MQRLIRAFLPRVVGRYGGVNISRDQYQIIREATGKNFTLAQIRGELVKEGISVRRQAIVDVRREIRGQAPRRVMLRNIGLSRRPSDASVSPTRFNIAREYRYVAKFRVRSPFDGTPHDMWIEFGDDRRLTMREFRARANEIMEQSGGAWRTPEGGSERGPIIGYEPMLVERRAV